MDVSIEQFCIFGLDVTWPTDAAPADPSAMLKFHTGAKSNNLTSVFLGDMRAKALGLRMFNGNAAVSLETRGKAEAAIRDSDMAREMTEYTEHNVLLQASQSMLAQANQNRSNVLSLLQ